MARRITLAPVINGPVGARAVVWLAIALVAPSGCTPGSDTPSPAASRPDRSATPSTGSPATEPSGPRLVESLRRGGYVIYLRHAATDPLSDDADPVDLGDCNTQRNLSDQGRGQSKTIGRAIERLDIPVGRVLASPFRRARQTARLAFGRVMTVPRLENLETADDERERQQRVDTLRRLLSTPPEEGTNAVLVAHGFNIDGAAGVVLDEEGEAVVFEPDSENSFRLIARLSPARWARLAARATRIAGVREYDVPAGSRPHDVAPAPDGSVWYTAQGSGKLGRLDPGTGETHHIRLGDGSAPHGVIVGPGGAPWITDGGLNAIVRVNPATERVSAIRSPMTPRSPTSTPRPSTAAACCGSRTGRNLWTARSRGRHGRDLRGTPGAGAVWDRDHPGR
jgi:phosphohistidine phosphatase SixA